MTRPIDPDEPVVINGVPVTGRQMAAAHQGLLYAPRRRWTDLTDREQLTAAIAAGAYLRCAADLTSGDSGS